MKKIMTITLCILVLALLLGCAEKQSRQSLNPVAMPGDADYEAAKSNLPSRPGDTGMVHFEKDIVTLQEGGSVENALIITNILDHEETFKLYGGCLGCYLDTKEITLAPGETGQIVIEIKKAVSNAQYRFKDSNRNIYGSASFSAIVE